MSEPKILNLAELLKSRRKAAKAHETPSVDEGIRLIRAFARIRSPARRAEVIAMVEHMAAKSARRGPRET